MQTRSTKLDVRLVVALAILMVLLAPALAWAQDGSTAVVSTLLSTMRRAARGWTTTLQDAARGVFAALATIQLGWTGIALLTKGQHSIAAAVGAFTREALILSFYYAVLENGPTWAFELIEQLEALGMTASASIDGVTPQEIVDRCVELCSREWEELGFFDLIPAVLAMLVGLLTLVIAFAAIAGVMFLAEMQAILVIAAGSVVLGCGGSVWTRSFVQGYLKHALGAGLKLMFVHLVQGVLLAHMLAWLERATASGHIDGETLLTALVSAIVIFILLITLPDYISAIVTGSVMTGGEAILGRAAGGFGLGLMGGAVALGARGVAGAIRAASGGVAAAMSSVGGGSGSAPTPPVGPVGGPPGGGGWGGAGPGLARAAGFARSVSPAGGGAAARPAASGSNHSGSADSGGTGESEVSAGASMQRRRRASPQGRTDQGLGDARLAADSRSAEQAGGVRVAAGGSARSGGSSSSSTRRAGGPALRSWASRPETGHASAQASEHVDTSEGSDDEGLASPAGASAARGVSGPSGGTSHAAANGNGPSAGSSHVASRGSGATSASAVRGASAARATSPSAPGRSSAATSSAPAAATPPTVVIKRAATPALLARGARGPTKTADALAGRSEDEGEVDDA